jgi:hypothetical protein
MCAYGDETDVRDDLFPHGCPREKVTHVAKFVGVPNSLLGVRPSRLPI